MWVARAGRLRGRAHALLKACKLHSRILGVSPHCSSGDRCVRCVMYNVLKVCVTLQGGVHRYSHARTDKVIVGRLPAVKGKRGARAPPP